MIDVDGVQMHSSLENMLVDASNVTEHPENARNGKVEAISESVKENGVYKPIVVQASTGYILSGNHTYRAITAAGASMVPVTWVDVDDAAAKRIMLADNRTGELGSYDEKQLAELLSDMGTLEGTGFTEDDLSDLLVTLEPPAATSDDAKPSSIDKERKYNEDGLDITVGFADGQRKVQGRRMMVLDLPVPVWLWLVDQLEALADDLGLGSNQDVLLKLVSDKVGQPVPTADADE